MTNAQLCPINHRRDEPAAPQLGVCTSHHRRLRHQLEQIGNDYTLLATMLEPGSTGNDHHQWRSRRVDPPAPARLDALVLRDRRTLPRGHQQPIPAIIAGYSRITALGRNMHQPATFHAQLGVLQTHLDWITLQAWVRDFATAIANCAHALAHDLGDLPTGPAYARCPLIIDGTECAGRIRALTYSLGVHCTRCGQQWIGDQELERLRQTLAS